MKALLRSLVLGFVCVVFSAEMVAAPPLPNVIMILCDDLGYADIGPFGCTAYATPHLDRMAKEGRKFTNFHVSQAVCSASRTALVATARIFAECASAMRFMCLIAFTPRSMAENVRWSIPLAPSPRRTTSFSEARTVNPDWPTRAMTMWTLFVPTSMAAMVVVTVHTYERDVNPGQTPHELWTGGACSLVSERRRFVPLHQ